MAALGSNQASSSAAGKAWFGNVMKSLGGATGAVFKSIAPNITKTGTDMYEGGKKVRSSLRPTSLVSIGRDLTKNKYVKLAKNTLNQTRQDLKSGKFYNPDRAGGALLGSDDAFDFDGFGEDFGDEEGGDTFVFGNNAEDNTATVALTGAVVQGSETTLAVGNAIIDSNMGMSSAIISELQSGFGEMSKQMETMNATMSALLQFHNDNTSKFYQDVVTALNRVSPAQREGTFTFNSDPMDIFDSGGALDTRAYKDYIKKQMKNVVASSPVGMVATFLSDDAMLEDMLSDPVGAISKTLVSSMIPAVAKQTLAEVDRTFGEFIPNMMMEFGKWATDPSKGKFQQMLGQIFGLQPTAAKHNTNMAAVTKDVATFDNITRNSIVEVLPKYARESTAYLREIALHLTKKEDSEILDGSNVFDAKQNKYVKRNALKSNMLEDIVMQLRGTFTGTDFGDAIDKIGNQLGGKDKESFDKTFEQFIVRLATSSKNLTERDYDVTKRDSEINKLLKGLGGKKDRAYLRDAIKYLYDNNMSIETAARAQQTLRSNWNSQVNSMSEDYDAYNLHAMGIDNDTDLVALLTQYQKDNGIKSKGSSSGRVEGWDGKKSKRRSLIETGASEWDRNKRRNTKESVGGSTAIEVLTGNTNIGAGFARAGGHAINAMHAAMKGDSRAAIQEFGSIFTDQMKNMWEGAKTHFLEPLGKKLFGKDDDGNAVGLFATAQNKMSDTYKATLQKINGKSYENSKGELIEAEPGTSLVDKATEIFSTVKTSVKEALFGKVDENGDKEKTGLLGTAKEAFSQGIQGWKEAIFGESENPDEEINKLKTKIKETMPSAIMGSAGGALVGAASTGSLLGTLVGGPVGGAIVGFGATFLAKSDRFKDYLFGPEIEDEDENGNKFKRRVGGLISEKAQKAFSKNKNSIIGGAALGTIKSMVFGGPGGILGTLVGGPIGGAIVGAGLGIVKNSETFQKFLYGDDESGKEGIVTSFKKMFGGGKGPNNEQASKDDLKALGMGATGAAGGAFGAALISKVGILGAMATPFGPLGGAIAGAAVGIAAGSKKFRTFLFGEKDKETGELKKTGLFQKFGNYLHVELFAPMRSKVMDIVDDMKLTLRWDILETVRLPFSIMANRIHESIGNAKDFLAEKVGGALIKGYEKLIKPLVGGFNKFILDPARKVISKGVDIIYNFSKATITAPFRLVRHIGKIVTSPIRKGLSRLGKMVFGGVRKLFGFAGSVIKHAFSPVTKLVGGVFDFVKNSAEGISDRINTGKEGGGVKGAIFSGLSKLTSSEWRKGDYANRAEREEAKRKNKVERQKRRITDENRRRIARELGYDVKYFTEENAQAAIAKAEAAGRKLKLRKGKGGDYGFEEDPVEKARKEKMKKSTADIARNGDSSDDMEVRMLTEAHRTNERLREIAELLRDGNLSEEERAKAEEERQELEQSQQDRVEEARRAGMEYDPETGEVRVAEDEPSLVRQTFDKWNARFEEAGGIGKYFKSAISKKFNNSWFGKFFNKDDSENESDATPVNLDDFSMDPNENLNRVRDMLETSDHARAKGGPVKKGEPYVVGEESPEIIVPDSNGNVLSQRNGGINVNVMGISDSVVTKLFPARASKRKLQETNIIPFPKKEDTKEKEEKKEEETVTVDENATNTYEGSRKVRAEQEERDKDNERQEGMLSTLKSILNINKEHKGLFSSIFSKKGLLTVALTAAGGLLLTHLPQVTEALPKIVDFGKNLWSGLTGALSGIGDGLSPVVDWVSSGINSVLKVVPISGVNKIQIPKVGTMGSGPLKGLATIGLGGLYLKAGSAIGSMASAIVNAGKTAVNTASTILGNISGGSKLRTAGNLLGLGSVALSAYRYFDPATHEHTDAAGNEIEDTSQNEAAHNTSRRFLLNRTVGAVEKAGGVNRTKLTTKAATAVKGTKNKITNKIVDKLQTEGNEKITDKIRNKAANKLQESMLSNADDVAESKGFMKYVKKMFEGIKNFLMKNKHFAKFAKKIATKIDDILLSIGKHADNIAKKLPGKISAIITKGTAKDSTGAATMGIGYAVMAFGGAVSGALSAANIFAVRESDVDAKMRIIASVIVALINGVPGIWALELADLVLEPFFGTTVRSLLCTLLYKLLGGSADLEEKQATFAKDVTEYNDTYGAELETEEYNDMVNKSAGAKIFGRGDVRRDKDGKPMFDEAGEVLRTNHGVAGWFAGGDKVYEHNADGSVARDENGKAIQAVDKYGRKQVVKKTWTDRIGDTNHQIGRFLFGGTEYETDENGNAIRDENGDYKVKKRTGNIFERGADWLQKNKVGEKVGKFFQSGWEGTKKVGGKVLDTLNPVKHAKRAVEFGKWLISSESKEVYVASDGSYYSATGEHFNANGESLGDKIDLETLSSWVSSGMLNPDEKVTKEAGYKILGRKIKDKLNQGWKAALELKDKAVNAFMDTGKKVGNKLLSLGTKGVRLLTHKEKVLMCNDGSGYYGINNGETFNKFSMSGDIIEENVPREDVLAMRDSGVLTEDTIKVEGNIRKKLKSLASKTWSGILDLKDKAVKGFMDTGKRLASKAKEIGISGVRLLTHKEKVWLLKDGSGYYRKAGDGSTWEKCNMDGDPVSEPISADDMKSLVDSGLVTEDTVKVDGTVRKKIKDLWSIGKKTFSGLMKTGKELFSKIGSTVSPFIESIKEKGLGATIVGAFKQKKKKGWYLIDGSGYYVMASNGKYEFFSMNGDKVESKAITAAKLQELIDSGLVKEGDVIEDSEAQKAINDIQSAVKDAWKTAKNTVKSGWDKFKNWIGLGGKGVETFTDESSNSTNSNSTGSTFGGSGNRKSRRMSYGGRGPDTQNGFAYFSQNDPSWAGNSFVSKEANDDATMADTGCGPTAMAMVASELGKGKNRSAGNVTPTDMARMASASGFRDDTGTNEQFIGHTSNELGLSHTESIMPGAGYIAENAALGRPMILNGISGGESGSAFTGSGHYVVVVGTDSSGNVLVNDPRGKEYSKAYKPEDLARQTRKAWSFGGNGPIRRFGKRSGRRKKMGGRGVSGDWLSIVRSVKALVAEQKPTYNQGGSMTINYNGQNVTLRPDCSGLVGCMLQLYGAIPQGANVTSRSLLADGAIPEGFTKGPWPGWEGLQEGDIISRSGHVEIFANNNGGHNVYNGGSTSALGSPGPTPTGHAGGYEVVWRPGNAGTGAGAVSGSAGGATVSSTGTAGGTTSNGGITDTLSKVGSVFTKFASKAMTGMLTGNWDFDFSDAAANSAGASATGGATPSGGAMDTNVSGSDVKEQTWNWMTTHGWSKEATAGIMGNMEQESGVNPTAIQGNGRGPAAGIVQWENYNTKQGRFANMEAFAKSQGKEWTDLGSQLAFMTQEMHDTTNGYYPKLGGMSADELMQTTDINGAVMAFRRGFERCKDEHANDARRLGAAQTYYNMYKDKTPSTSATSAGGFGGRGVSGIRSTINRFGGCSGETGSVQPDMSYGRLYDASAQQQIKQTNTNLGINNVTLNTSSLEGLISSAIKVLQAIESNTSKIEGLNVSNANVNNGGNVVIQGGTNIQSPEKRNSTNASLAQLIAKG